MSAPSILRASVCRRSLSVSSVSRAMLTTPTLHTARLLLRPFKEADTDAIFVLHSSPRVLRYWDAPPWKERTRAERFIEVCRQIEQEGTGARLAIERAADGVFIGWCGLVKWNPDYRSAKMGYCLDDAAWGQGFATEAAGALLRWAFDTLDLTYRFGIFRCLARQSIQPR